MSECSDQFVILCEVIMLSTDERQEICILKSRHGLARAVARMFNENHPERPVPISHTTVNRVWNKWLQSKSLEDRPRSGRPPIITNENCVQVIKQCLQENDQRSIKELSEHTGFAKKTIYRMLHVNKFFPYKAAIHQKILPHDPVERLAFCHYMINQIEAEPQFLTRLMMSDESNFTCSGAFNRQNNRYPASSDKQVDKI